MDTELEYICLRSSYPVGQTYYRLDLRNNIGYREVPWLNFPADIQNARLNLVCLTKNEAKQLKVLIINYLSSNKEYFNFITEEPRDGKHVWVSDILDPEFTDVIRYNSDCREYRHLFKIHFLYETKEEALNASKGIIQFLRKESAQNHFKPITKAPQDGTKVYVADVTAKDGYKYIIYNSEFEYLLNDRLLFSNMLGAIRATTAMRQLINPVVPEFTS